MAGNGKKHMPPPPSSGGKKEDQYRDVRGDLKDRAEKYARSRVGREERAGHDRRDGNLKPPR
jgi:hypothetical protein